MDQPENHIRDVAGCLSTTKSLETDATDSVDLRVLQNKVQKAIEAASMIVLRNADHSRTLGDGLWKSYKAGHLVDIVVHCHGHSTRAHRVVLSVYSPVLRASMEPTGLPPPPKSISEDAMQEQQQKQNQDEQQKQQSMHVGPQPFICLDDVVHRARDLDILLEFMYRGQVSLPKTGLHSLLRTAEILEIWSLVNAIKARSDDLEQALEEHQLLEAATGGHGAAMIKDDIIATATDVVAVDVDEMIIKLEPPDHQEAAYNDDDDDFEDIEDDGGGGGGSGGGCGATPMEMEVESLLADDERILDAYFKYKVEDDDDDVDVACVETAIDFNAVQVQRVLPSPRLDNNLTDEPKKKARFRCQYCGKAFSSNQAYVVHHMEHADLTWRLNRKNRCPNVAATMAVPTGGSNGDVMMINQLLVMANAPTQELVPVQLIKSNKGKDLLVHQNRIYRLDRIRGTSRYWRCNQYDSCKCKARAVTIDNNVSEVRGVHNHPPEKATVDAKQISSNIKEQARTTRESIKRIESPASPSPSTTVPKEPTMRRRRLRMQRSTDATASTNPSAILATAAPSSPANLRDLAIPHLYSTTLNDEDFLLFDSGPSDDRIVLFSTNHNLQLLRNTPDWYVDCSVRIVPPLFRQLCTIHAVCQGEVLPVVYLLLPDRRRKTYERAFDALRSLRPDLGPKSIVTDVSPESHDTVGALDACFESAVLRGCRFHFCQSLWQRVQRHHRHSLVDAEFTSHFRRLLCLCFVPPDQVAAKFDELNTSEAFRGAVSQTLIDHFEETYVGRCTRLGGRQAPTLTPHLWNCYEDLVANDRDRQERSIAVNDSLENWHRRFVTLMSRCIDCPRPSIWKFIVKLKEEQARNDVLILRNLAGVWPATTTSAAAARRAAHMRAAVQDFANRNLEDYLTSVSGYVHFYV